MNPTKRFKTTWTPLIDRIVLGIVCGLAAMLVRSVTGFDIAQAVRGTVLEVPR